MKECVDEDTKIGMKEWGKWNEGNWVLEKNGFMEV